MMPDEDGPIVSVVVPFYDSVDVLQRALRSVRNQNFAGPVETIVVVDGSHEDLSAVRANFPGVVLIHQENAGPGPARNRGIEAARGEFIAFLDADDHWLPTKLTVQIEAMRRDGAAWSQHSYTVVCPDAKPLRHVDTSRYAGHVLRETLLSFRIQTSAVMVRRACLRDPGLRFGADRVGEDGHFYTRMAAKYPLTSVGEALGYFTWHGANAGGRADVQLWSRARTWDQNRVEAQAVLPLLGRLAYRWCALAVRILRYPRENPPSDSSGLAAKVAYAPSYLAFHLLAKRLSS